MYSTSTTTGTQHCPFHSSSTVYSHSYPHSHLDTQRHAYVDSLEIHCRTPLMLSAACNLSDICTILLDAGSADVMAFHYILFSTVTDEIKENLNFVYIYYIFYHSYGMAPKYFFRC